MSGMNIYVRNAADKKALVDEYLAGDERHLEALEKLRQELISQGIDITKGEGRKTYIRAVRKLTESGGCPAAE